MANFQPTSWLRSGMEAGQDYFGFNAIGSEDLGYFVPIKGNPSTLLNAHTTAFENSE